MQKDAQPFMGILYDSEAMSSGGNVSDGRMRRTSGTLGKYAILEVGRQTMRTGIYGNLSLIVSFTFGPK